MSQWGTGSVASVDGLRFVVPSASVRTGANPRYFGQYGKGVTWLNYVNGQVAGLGGLVVTGTVRDSLHVLDGLLDLDGGPRPEMIATDAASYSDQVFGLFALLGYQFSPRLADMPDQKFWRADPAADYGPLNALAGDRKHVLDLELIRRNWPDLLRVAGSLSTGAMKASELMRITQGGGSPTTLGKALAENGQDAGQPQAVSPGGIRCHNRDVGVGDVDGGERNQGRCQQCQHATIDQGRQPLPQASSSSTAACTGGSTHRWPLRPAARVRPA